MCGFTKYVPYVFLDVDGVCTSAEETPGSYMTNRGGDYGVSKGPFRRLASLLADTGAKVVVSSNWRKFEDSGPGSVWHNMVYGDVANPLPRLRRMLGSCYLGDLPKARRCSKSQALRMWFDDAGLDPAECRYVVFDDDPREGFQDSEFAGHFVKTDCRTGLTDADCERAKEILGRGGEQE